jgi:hypothetical protein
MTLDVGTKRRLCERRGANDHDWTLAALPNRSENSNPKLEAERNEKWLMSEKNCRRRAVHDAGLPQRGCLDIATLCYEAEDYHWEFFMEQFFCKAFCGYDVEYDPIWRGIASPRRLVVSLTCSSQPLAPSS